MQIRATIVRRAIFQKKIHSSIWEWPTGHTNGGKLQCVVPLVGEPVKVNGQSSKDSLEHRGIGLTSPTTTEFDEPACSEHDDNAKQNSTPWPPKDKGQTGEKNCLGWRKGQVVFIIYVFLYVFILRNLITCFLVKIYLFAIVVWTWSSTHIGFNMSSFAALSELQTPLAVTIDASQTTKPQLGKLVWTLQKIGHDSTWLSQKCPCLQWKVLKKPRCAMSDAGRKPGFRWSVFGVRVGLGKLGCGLWVLLTAR